MALAASEDDEEEEASPKSSFDEEEEEEGGCTVVLGFRIASFSKVEEEYWFGIPCCCLLLYAIGIKPTSIGSNGTAANLRCFDPYAGGCSSSASAAASSSLKSGSDREPPHNR